MKKIEIHINEYGPLSGQTITLAPFMLFIGKSGLGKSYANYLTYYFFSSFTQGRLKGPVENKLRESRPGQPFTITADELCQWLNDGAEPFLRALLGNDQLTCRVHFTLPLEEKQLTVSYTQEDLTAELPQELEGQQIIIFHVTVNASSPIRSIAHTPDRTTDPTASSVTQALSLYLQAHLFGETFARSVLLPPSRSVWACQHATAPDSASSPADLYHLSLRDAALSSICLSIGKSSRRIVTPLVEELIGGTLSNRKGRLSLKLSNGPEIPLTASASSVQELTPLLFHLLNWSDVPHTLCLENPETQLSPDRQVGIANLLSLLVNRSSFLHLTTHSDYFLQRINQLIKTGYIRQEHPQTFRRLCKEHKLNSHFYLDARQIKAYYFHADEHRQSHIEELEIGRNGIPFSPYFDTINRLRDDDNFLNTLL